MVCRKCQIPYSMSHFCNEVSLAGVKPWSLERHIPGKVIWTIVIILAFGATIRDCCVLFQSFTAEEKGTRVNDAWAPDRMPAVSICPQDWLNTTKLKEEGISQSVTKFALGYLNFRSTALVGGDDSKEFENQTKLLEIQQDLQKALNRYKSLAGLLVNMSLDADDFIPRATMSIINDIILTRHITPEGVCYRAKAKDSLSIAEMEMAVMTIQLNSDKKTASRILVGHELEYGVAPVTVRYVLPQASYAISVSMSKIKRISTKATPCRSGVNPDGTQRYLCAFTYSSQTLCKNMCQLYIGQPGNFSVADDVYCNQYVGTSVECGVKITKSSISKSSWTKICPMACEQITTDFTIEQVAQSENGTIAVKVMTVMDAVAIEEYLVFPVDKFMSQMGGAMSLYFGASIVTTFHILYYLLASTWHRVQDRKKIGGGSDQRCEEQECEKSTKRSVLDPQK